MIKIFLQSILLFLLVIGSAFAVYATGVEVNGSGQIVNKGQDPWITSEGKMILLGNADQQGVKAMAHLKDIEKTMAEPGSNATHHLMVVFLDQEKGELIESGSATVKFRYENQKVSDPMPLTAMQGHYGTDLTLNGPGEYQFIIGSQLTDGRKRKFRFEFTLR